VAVALEDAVAVRWLVGEPATSVVITTEESTPGVVDVSIENHFRAKVHLADRYPTAPDPTIVTGGAPPHTAREIYDLRWMFHGPSFQGIAETRAFGPDGIVGRVVALPPPGALLDAVGQLFGYWVAYSTTEDRMAFPFRIDRIDFYGPDPAPGDELTAYVGIAALEPTIAKGTFDVARSNGRLWARITHFTDRRFEGDHRMIEKMYHPEVSTIGEERGPFWLFHDASTPANRELMMRRYLAADERAAYADRPPRGQKGWLLGRVAVKDAVRAYLWERGHGPIYPIEVGVHHDQDGRPTVTCPGDRDLRVSLAHSGSVAVAIVAEGHDVGIDLEPIEPRSERFAELVVTEGERALGRHLDPDRWLTRLWTAKEAVAKARGTGLQGRPKDFEAVELDGEWLRIGEHWVHSTTENTPEGEFVVSHTAPR
jgi:phosphopantetheinyl transferase (holo-ACP synthase)